MANKPKEIKPTRAKINIVTNKIIGRTRQIENQLKLTNKNK
jgi:hypothetical protein